MNKGFLIVCLLVLTACDNICFDIVETPKMIDTFYDGRTEHELTGDIKMIVTSCEVNKTEEKIDKVVPLEVIKETNNCKSDCTIDGQKWQCSDNKCCEESIVDGLKMGLCKDKD